MLLAKHAASNSRMRRYLEFIQSFEPTIKLKWQSSKDPSFKIVDFISRPETVGEPTIVDKNMPSTAEKDIELRCDKLTTATSTVDNYILLMDFILEQPDSDIEKLDDCSVFIDENSNICTGSPGNITILKAHVSYLTPGLPGSIPASPTRLVASNDLQSCSTEAHDPCDVRDIASDIVVPSTQQVSGSCGSATPPTLRTIDIGISKTDTDLICTDDILF